MIGRFTLDLLGPVGDWVCLKAETFLGSGAVGLAASDAYDEHGLVARSAQALLVTPAP